MFACAFRELYSAIRSDPIRSYDNPLSAYAMTNTVKQFMTCDTIGTVEAVIVESDKEGHPHLGVKVPTKASAEGKAGGDSTHDFVDQ